MLRSSFRKVFLARSRDAVLLLVRTPLTEANRPGLAAAARRAAVESLLAARFPLVRICHDISILASAVSGPGIPEGAVRVRRLRAALQAAEGAADRPADAGIGDAGPAGPGLPGCPCARIVPVRGRLPLSSAVVERARDSGAGLRILRFRPSGLRGSPQELLERLADLSRRDFLLGLYAITGRRPASAAREFALLVPDRATAPGGGPEGAGPDPLAGFPVTGRIRTLVAAGPESVPDLTGFDLAEGGPGPAPDGRSASAAGSAGPAAIRARETAAPAGRRAAGTGAAEGILPKGRAASRTARGGASRDGEYRNAAVLRAEIPELLAVVRGSDPRRAAEFLNLALSRLARCAESADGVVDSFAGGTILAFWGAPASTGKDAEAAGRAALGMRRVAGILSRGRAVSGEPRLRLSCALDASPVLAGWLGSPARRSYTVAGEAVRRSAGIGYLNRALGTDILVSEYAMRLMGNAFRFHPADSLGGTGKDGSIGVYALLGRRGDPACPRDIKDLQELLGTV